MADDFATVFGVLRGLLVDHADRLSIKADSPVEFTVTTKVASPFPQHKGELMWFASVRVGKAYVSFHLLPVYMDPGLNAVITPSLKKRMQGKACFNFKSSPDVELLAGLRALTNAAIETWTEKGWM